MFIVVSSGCARAAHSLPKSLQRGHCTLAMVGAYSGILLDHAQGLPATFLADRFQIDAGHDALACPVMAPIVDVKITDPRSAAGRCVGLLDGTTAWHLIGARISIRTPAVR